MNVRIGAFQVPKKRYTYPYMESERRISHQLVNYWQQIKGDRPLPTLRDIDQDDIPEMWPHCFIVHIHDHHDGTGIAYTYEYIGDTLHELMLDGESLPPYLAVLPYERLLDVHNEMSMTNLPIVESVEDLQVNGRGIKSRLCLLPVGDGTGSVTSIFGGMRFIYA